MSEGVESYVLHYGAPEYMTDSARRRAGRLESAWAEWDDQRFEARSRSSASMKLARMLVAAGAPDGPWRTVTLAGTPSLSGPSLRRWAKLTISEPDTGTVKIVPFVECDPGLNRQLESVEGPEGSEDTSEEPDGHPGHVRAARSGQKSRPSPLPEQAAA